MKLLNKTSIYYLGFTLPLCIVCSLLIYFFISSGIRDELDESLLKEKGILEQKLERQVDPLALNTDEIAVAAANKPLQGNFFSDISIYDTAEAEMVPYRVLRSGVSARGQAYNITISRSYVETDDLIFSILAPVILLFVLLLAGFFLINYRISKKVWAPFYETIGKLKSFELEQQHAFAFGASAIDEFNMLNQSLNAMTRKAYSDYMRQKEFTENASHEMQTPLAIIRNKIELLIQSKNLGNEEMEIIAGIYESAGRLSRLNKTLLLLAKIENHQFGDTTRLNIKEIVQKSIALYSELAGQEQIEIKAELDEQVWLQMNATLAEVMINNLVLNALRHNTRKGAVRLQLQADQLIISNTGKKLSLPPEQLFGRFKKDNSSAESTGLGLSIVQSVCALYTISVSYRYEDEKHFFILQWLQQN